MHGKMNDDSEEQLDNILKAADGLDSLRRKVEDDGISSTQAYEYYNKLVDLCYTFRSSLHAVPDTDLDKQGRALVAMIRAREALSREDALYLSALTARKMTMADLQAMSDLIAERTLLYEINLPILPDSEQKVFADYRRTNAAPAALRVAEGKVLSSMDPATAIRALDQEHSGRPAAHPVLERLRPAGRRGHRPAQEAHRPGGQQRVAQGGDRRRPRPDRAHRLRLRLVPDRLAAWSAICPGCAGRPRRSPASGCRA
ncbi:hypothetical protein SANTM175S_09060 [Streptomyces antimycoticus]